MNEWMNALGNYRNEEEVNINHSSEMTVPFFSGKKTV